MTKTPLTRAKFRRQRRYLRGEPEQVKTLKLDKSSWRDLGANVLCLPFKVIRRKRTNNPAIDDTYAEKISSKGSAENQFDDFRGC